MNYEQDEELIDLGAVTEVTHGVGGSIHPDTPQGRLQLGILVD